MFITCPLFDVILSPIRSILDKLVSWKQLLLGDSIGILSSYRNRTRAEFLWIIWKPRNCYVFNEAYQAPNLKTLFVRFNLQVIKQKVNEVNVYYLRNEIAKDAEKMFQELNEEEQDLPMNSGHGDLVAGCSEGRKGDFESVGFLYGWWLCEQDSIHVTVKLSKIMSADFCKLDQFAAAHSAPLGGQ
ncbi:hypothetical protein L7F22_032141 [Adiantum nelumboides]|nr:hypothetical protein [Adiantum nelumboides]